MCFEGNPARPVSRREALGALVVAAATAGWPRGAGAQAGGIPVPADAAHRIVVDVPILADDPVSIPLTVSLEHPMQADHYIRTLEVELATKQSRAVLEERARRTLGMVTPKRGQVVDVR